MTDTLVHCQYVNQSGPWSSQISKLGERNIFRCEGALFALVVLVARKVSQSDMILCAVSGLRSTEDSECKCLLLNCQVDHWREDGRDWRELSFRQNFCCKLPIFVLYSVTQFLGEGFDLAGGLYWGTWSARICLTPLQTWLSSLWFFLGKCALESSHWGLALYFNELAQSWMWACWS